MIENKLNNKSKGFLMRNGDAHVFGKDSDVRKKLTDEQMTVRFDQVWNNVLEPNLRTALQIPLESARSKLEGRSLDFVLEGYQYREFSIDAASFIARLNKDATESGNCDQMWIIGRNRDFTRLSVYFETIDAKNEFDSRAILLGWKPEQLALSLLMDFMSKFPKNNINT